MIGSCNAAVATEDSCDPRNRLPPRIFLVAYLVHLAVPLVLAIDSFRTMYEGTADNLTCVMGFVCMAWMTVALGALLLTRDRQRFLNRMSKPVLIFFVFASRWHLAKSLSELSSGTSIEQC